MIDALSEWLKHLNTWRTDVSWRAIIVFFTVSVLVAAPFNLGYADTWLQSTFPSTPLSDWTFLPAALGPTIGAIIARRLDPRVRMDMTIMGVQRGPNVLVAILPVVAFAFFGGVGWLLPVVALVYALGEEFGWRGYLADATHSLSSAARYTLTALLWWPWHLRFETTFDWIGFPLIVLASSWILGHAAKESRSVLVAAAMHSSIILLTVNGPPGNDLLVAGAVTLGGWILIGIVFPARNKSAI